MGMVIERISPQQIDEYAQVPSVCEVRSVLRVEQVDAGLGGMFLREQEVSPYQKDYDGYGDGPRQWSARFEISNWGLWLAREADQVIGAAAVAWNTSGVHMLEGQSDLAVLWDIRVRASAQRQGVGTALFTEAAEWARSNRCALLKIETQNVNVSACRFYARMGCFLGGIDRLAYRNCPAVAKEIMLLWYLDLATQHRSAR